MFGNDHLCSDVVESLPEVSVLQGHLYAALLVQVGHRRGRWHAAGGLGVCGERGTGSYTDG